MTITVPDDLRRPDYATLLLDRDDRRLLEETKRQLAGDLRFEYLNKRELNNALRRFVCAAFIDRRTDHVTAFIKEFVREPKELRCYFPLLYLTIAEPYELNEVLFLPLGDGRIPASDRLDTDPPTGAVVSVMTQGTKSKFMMERARRRAEHALRVLRVAMRKHPGLHHSQLRFHLGETYVLEDLGAGWQRREDAPWMADLTQEMRSLIEDQSLSSIPFQPATDVEKKAQLALRWIDRARLSTDRLEATLFLFFALEGLLGDRKLGTKAHNLVFRRTVLGHAVTGSFPDPLGLFYLYDKVRSAAVHGSEAPEVSRSELVSFDRNVRSALNEFLTFAKSHGAPKRSQVVGALVSHQDAPQALAWLRQHDPETWSTWTP